MLSLYHVVLLFIVWKLSVQIWIFLKYLKPVRNFLSKRKDLPKSGEWAIITGATDGIGKAFAQELAKDGLNIFLISRTADKLIAVSKELKDKYKIQTKVFCADFTKTDFYDVLQTKINELSSVACLINNVGMSQVCAGPVASCEFLTLDYIQRLIHCNIISTACVTRIVLPKMLSSTVDVHHKPCVVSMGSVSGIFPRPYKSLYAASKSFVHNFDASVAAENEKIRFLTLTPGFISTASRGAPSTNWLRPSAETFAASALNMIGVSKTCCGYLGHEFMVTGMSILPNVIRNRIVAMFERKNRADYLAKLN